MLYCPLLFSDKVGGGISVDENRYLAKFPQMSFHKGITEELENWISDNAGGRTWLRSIYNYANINLLGSKRDDVNFYIDDWVFLLNETTLQYLQNSDIMSDEEIEQFVENYEHIRVYLLEQGIVMGTLVFPHKVEAYSEKFTEFVNKINEKSNLDILREISENHQEFNLEVLYNGMVQKKEEGKMFYSKAYDTSHWNNQGAYWGYQMLMQLVKQELPEINILSENDLEVNSVQREKYYNSKVYREDDLAYDVVNPKAVLDLEWFKQNEYVSEDMWQSYKYYKNSDSTLPKIVIVGDSYVWMFMLPWIAESFSETVFIHQLDYKNFESIKNIIEPDIVIFSGLQNTVISGITDVASQIVQ